ncbi:hypothetical protein RHSIM_Rhsim01G0096700 [Rhododendron simsii]|uniref:Disease resistance R13L4/SHOC-2-like LRR domain-containing protein n=1 Tax=Rhododendron simsii TaxID=118357 RepID=A0A834LW32_RHOSS|nr:hypothetical protein RHSIM_Rhsim01G0096700 [Rhododendron simsii]
MDKLWYCEHVLEVRRDGMDVDSIGFSLIPVQASNCLTELNLIDCHLSYLPDEIGNLISLRNLDLAQNNLSTLPSGIGRLISLEILNLERNSLCTLPDTVGKLSCLKELDVRYNKLSHLPSEIGDLDSLEILVLEGNRGFRSLPESICKLVRLRDLSLYDCNLSHLPSEIDRLISLESLGLACNRSLTLPDSIWHLTSLDTLRLGGCNLSHLPSAIGGLVSLVILEIWENNICTIPDGISNLPRLRHIQLNNCANLRSLPKLPGCYNVLAYSCPSLESLPLELDQLGRHADYSGFNKLAENNYLTSLLKQLPKSKGLSKLQHAVDILVPVAGDEEVRIWFPYHDGRGPNVSFVVPHPPSLSVNQKIVGWILRLLVGPPGGLTIQDVIFNKIEKRGLFDFVVFHRPEVDLVWLLYIPQGYARLRLKGGDEVEIPIIARNDNAVVKNWAIDVIYDADDELHKGNDALYQVVCPI